MVSILNKLLPESRVSKGHPRRRVKCSSGGMLERKLCGVGRVAFADWPPVDSARVAAYGSIADRTRANGTLPALENVWEDKYRQTTRAFRILRGRDAKLIEIFAYSPTLDPSPQDSAVEGEGGGGNASAGGGIAA